jgi:DNA-binding FadR family transcriptional regulator
MRRHLEAEADLIRRMGPAIQRLPASAALQETHGNKRAEGVARDIFTDILNGDLQPGDFVGSEASLISERNVSRAVLREAIRILEYHQIAMMRRGPGGGLFVAAPDPAALTDVVSIYLRRRGIQDDDFAELRSGFELAVIERVAARLADDNDPGQDEVAATLRAYLEGTSPIEGHAGVHWHAMIASCCGNRAIDLIHRVTMRLGWLFFSRNAESDPAVRRLSAPASFEPAHHGITQALLADDKELALMRMRAHLAATQEDHS